MKTPLCKGRLFGPGWLWLLPAVVAAPAAGQVFNSGPFDSSLFDVVIIIPDDQPSIQGQVGAVAGQTSQLNMNGGTFGEFFDANSRSEISVSAGAVGGGFNAGAGSEMNISGGVFGNGFRASSSSKLRISGGRFGSLFRAYSGSEVSISGGSFGDMFRVSSGSAVELIGGEFRLNGAPFAGASFTLKAGDLFTGTLADGSSFIFNSVAGDTLEGITLTPPSDALPMANLTPQVVSARLDAGDPSGLRRGQTLTVEDGGVLGDNFAVVGATLNIDGGEVGRDLEAGDGAVVNVRGGSVGLSFDAHAGSEVNISGGMLDGFFNAYSGSTVSISGGIAGSASLTAHPGSDVRIRSGRFGNRFNATPGSQVSLSGGSFGRSFRVSSGSDARLIGGEFRLNGAPFAGANFTLAEGDLFTGTLADGSSFVFHSIDGDTLEDVILAAPSHALPVADLTPRVVSTRLDADTPSGLRRGQTLTVEDGGVLGDDFAVVGATLNVHGGEVGSGLEAAEGSVVNLSGGSVGYNFHAFSGSEVNINSGPFPQVFKAYSGSQVNLFGTEFLLDGVPLNGLVQGVPFHVIGRSPSFVLAGLLADGTPFDIRGSQLSARDEFFAPDAVITVTLVVPEPASTSAMVTLLFAYAGLRSRQQTRRARLNH